MDTNKSLININRQEIALIVFDQISESFFTQSDSLNLETRFEEDLCVDKVLLKDCLDTLEDEFVRRAVGFSLDDKDLLEMETIGDLIELICERVFPREYGEVNNG